MSKCNECTYYGLMKMVTSGQPFQYFGDIPCNRCAELKNDHSEFTPTSKEIPKKQWDNLGKDKHYSYPD